MGLSVNNSSRGLINIDIKYPGDEELKNIDDIPTGITLQHMPPGIENIWVWINSERHKAEVIDTDDDGFQTFKVEFEPEPGQTVTVVATENGLS